MEISVNKCNQHGCACQYASIDGSCKDDIYTDFGLCAEKGDVMPDVRMSSNTRRAMAESMVKKD